MNLVVRAHRYFERVGIVGLSPFSCLIILLTPKAPYAWPLFAFSMAMFILPYPFRYFLIKQIEKPLMNFLDQQITTAGILISAFIWVINQQTAACFIVVGSIGLDCGIRFWTRTDELYLMNA